MAINSNEKIKLKCSCYGVGLTYSIVARLCQIPQRAGTVEFTLFLCITDMVEKEIHIGKIVHNKLRKKGLTVTWFAKKICCTRNHVYKIFNRKSLDTALIMRVSEILNDNLFRLLADVFDNRKAKGIR